MDRLRQLRESGVSIWLDDLSRDLLETGEFADLVTGRHVTGATSNPTIFAKAITGSSRYDSQLALLADAEDRDPQELFFSLALDDVRRAADILRSVYIATEGTDGFVSFECTPDLAHDTDATIAQARDLWTRLERPNTMIKVPATPAGIPAIEQLTADGINVNVTLLFSVPRYEQVMDAYQSGLEARLAVGKSLAHVASVASFFVSRVDTKVDVQLPTDSTLRGNAARANATVAFATFKRATVTKRWQRLAAAGARPQRPLWASTGTKDAAYSDVMYVESLIASGVVNTMPQATLDAFEDHGRVNVTLTGADDEAEQLLDGLRQEGIDVDVVASQLEREGIQSFRDSYARLLACIHDRVESLLPASTRESHLST